MQPLGGRALLETLEGCLPAKALPSAPLEPPDVLTSQPQQTVSPQTVRQNQFSQVTFVRPGRAIKKGSVHSIITQLTYHLSLLMPPPLKKTKQKPHALFPELNEALFRVSVVRLC